MDDVVWRMAKGVGSAGGPGEVASAEDVEVDVEDGLADVGAVVDDEAVAGLFEALFAGDFGAGEHELAEEFGVIVGGVVEVDDVFFGDDEDVDRGGGGDVAECDAVFVFVDAVVGEFSA